MSDGNGMITEFMDRAEVFETEYGRVTAQEWLQHEKSRMEKKGVKTHIVEKQNDNTKIALARI